MSTLRGTTHLFAINPYGGKSKTGKRPPNLNLLTTRELGLMHGISLSQRCMLLGLDWRFFLSHSLLLSVINIGFFPPRFRKRSYPSHKSCRESK